MSTTDPKFWLGEPIWLTAQKAGLTAKTASWPGAEVPLERGPGPRDTWDVASSAIPYKPGTVEERVDTVLALLNGPAPPDFVTLYLDDVDHAGHGWGPDSAQVDAAVDAVDAGLWRLITGLGGDALLNKMHIIITSDHGMAPAYGPQQQVPAELVLPPDLMAKWSLLTSQGAWFSGTSGGIPCVGCSLAAARELAASINAFARQNTCGDVSCATVVTAYAKEDLPPTTNGYAPTTRVPAVICLPALGWSLTTKTVAQLAVETPFISGEHGWDPRWGAMEATLLAVGPRFQANTLLRSPEQVAVASTGGTPDDLVKAGAGIRNVEVYGLLAELLGISDKTAPHNGTKGYPQNVLLPVCEDTERRRNL